MRQAPSQFRDTLRLFLRYDPEQGLDHFFGSVDWSAASPRQLAHAFLDRPPLPGASHLPDPAAEARRLFESDGFRRGLLRRVLMALPGKQRLLFVHLPKCAGTDFEVAMRPAHPSLHQGLDWIGATDAAGLAERLHLFVCQAQKADTVFVGGHVPLPWYIDNNLYRFDDRLMTIVRHPHEIAVSFANYVAHCMKSDPDFKTRDVRQWGSMAGIARFNPAWTDSMVKSLAQRLVTLPGLMPVNPICALLGDGTAATSFANLGRVDMEITDVTRYGAWLKARWGIERSVRANSAPQLVASTDLSAAEKACIEAASTQDMLVYTAIMRGLDSTGGLSVSGPQIACI
jgi:hypothetical protein